LVENNSTNKLLSYVFYDNIIVLVEIADNLSLKSLYIMNGVNMNLGERIHDLRKKSKMSQDKLAQKLGVSYQAVSKWENHVSSPDVGLLPELSDVFGVSIDYLLKGSYNRQVDYYDNLYKKNDIYLNPPSEMCIELLKLMPPNKPIKVLELCCGEGDDAIFLARNGYKVTCFDLSEYAIGKLNRKADLLGLSINSFVADIREFNFEEAYDVIYSKFGIHYIPMHLRRDWIDTCMSHTRKNGINAFTTFVEKPYLDKSLEKDNISKWATGDLVSYYNNWLFEEMKEEIIDYDQSKEAVFSCIVRNVNKLSEMEYEPMKNGNWEKIYIEQGRVQLEVLDTVVDAADTFEKNSCKEILDLGCGTGRHSLYLASRGFDLSVCDISETGLKITQDLLEASDYKNIKYDIQDMYHMTYKQGTFDGILCIWVQGHGYRDQVKKGIEEAYRVLKPGGLLITDFVTVEDVTYGVGDEIAPHTFLGGRAGEEDIPHYYSTKEDLEIMFKQYAQVDYRDKIYQFEDRFGSEHTIHSIVVTAKK